jgi:biotin carboxylase
MANVLCICPTHRDHRELAGLNGKAPHNFWFHDYASLALEDLTAGEPAAGETIPDPIAELGRVIEFCERAKIEAVVSTDDYPGSTMASALALALGLPGTSPKSNLLCQHKFFSRQLQAAAAPDAVPEFQLMDVAGNGAGEPMLKFPFFIKPVKSFFSVGAQRIASPRQLCEMKAKWARSTAFFRPFDLFLRQYTGHTMGTNLLIAEGLLEGAQATLDGYVYEREVHAMGVVDSIMFPGTIAFQRFEYPSQLPESVQERMVQVARRVLPSLGFEHGQFNIEFMYDPNADRLSIIEINPRMSSQFADLFEKVDGTNSYSVLLDLALGQSPSITHCKGRHAAAASCVLRTFQNQRVRKLPGPDEIGEVQASYPDARIEILATEGRKLSEQMQDSCSFRYGLVNVGGRDREEVLQIFDDCLRRLTFVLEPV